MNAIAFNIALPLLSAFLLPVIHSSSALIARLVGPAILLCMLTLATLSWMTLDQPQSIALGGFLPPLGISFHIDQLALLMVMIIPLLMLLLWPYRNSEGLREESLLLLLAAAATGLALSADLFNMYVFYELLSVASFGLAAARRTPAALAASYRYLIISGLGTVLALTGIALIYTQTGTLNLAHIGLLASQLDNGVGFSAFALIVLGIGVKAEVFPVNGWVPEVYASASVRVSSLLAGLISKLAVLVMIRLLVVAYNHSDALMLLLVLGCLGIIWGELSALASRDLKRMFAYSSIGQLGIILVAFSIPGEAGMLAGIAMMLHHLVVKPGLFLLTENWNGSIKNLQASDSFFNGSKWLFALFALSLIGVPPFPGFWAKLLVVTGLTGMESSAYITALVILLTATVIEAGYLMRAAIPIFSLSVKRKKFSRSVFNPGFVSIFAVILLVALMTLTPLAEKLQHIGRQSSDRMLYINTTFSSDMISRLELNNRKQP